MHILPSLSIIYLENKTQKSCFSKIVGVEKHACVCKPLYLPEFCTKSLHRNLNHDLSDQLQK